MLNNSRKVMQLTNTWTDLNAESRDSASQWLWALASAQVGVSKELEGLAGMLHSDLGNNANVC